METGRSSSVYSAYSSVRSMPRTSPSDDTISVTTRPHPPWRFTRRRNAVSVIPAMGATTNGDERATFPMFIGECISVGSYVGGIDFDADGLADQVDREHEPCVRALAQESAHNPFERAVHNLHHLALPKKRPRSEA